MQISSNLASDTILSDFLIQITTDMLFNITTTLNIPTFSASCLCVKSSLVHRPEEQSSPLCRQNQGKLPRQCMFVPLLPLFLVQNIQPSQHSSGAPSPQCYYIIVSMVLFRECLHMSPQ